ncbi:MAG: hypothetical protein COU90_03805 [Candidatus Ryanbacteria bacterium CG10_big_fil_rev_8_21_14_0_10_43_42]|uniref:Lipoprotein n=1 Tax=Candidatus Ryanbacteria bacterium CG10_big_fil_rev_8_21_14_0_10_43_42 TaxID=1974864 RepID=A0A2M8KW98_9BACT|nr:MAG: hypothetical protein COU90_03805 [Candidatus Ryanbacteria bacterium CG10_big_fil_rev_8_21_14_0_10_43_42]
MLGWCVVLSLSGCTAAGPALMQYTATNIASEFAGRAIGGVFAPKEVGVPGKGVETRNGSLSVFVRPVSGSARWTEFQFSATNKGNIPITISSVQGVDVNGLYRHQTSALAPQKSWSEPVDSLGLNSLGIGAVMLGSSVPYAGRMFGAGLQHALTGNPQQELARLHETQIQSATLAPGGTVSGSIFFPSGEYKQLAFSVFNGRKYESFVIPLQANVAPRARSSPLSLSPATPGEKIYKRGPDGYIPVS